MPADAALELVMDFLSHIEKRVFVIAEIGKGFIQTEDDRPVDEYLANAKALVKAAKDAGADAAKFQTHTVEDEQLNISVTSPHFKGADRHSWVTRNTNATPIEGFWQPLKKYCDEIGIQFFSTPMSRNAVILLNDLGVDLWKVGSGDILDFVMLDHIAQTGKPVIISSGMSTLEEVDRAMEFLRQRTVPVTLLHCVSKYPCPPEELNLSTMNFLRERYGVPVGFSDHSIGIDSALAAVALGARVIEKHFSFDRNLWGSDHKVSMTPDELREMVESIRQLERNPEKKSEYLEKDIVKRGMGSGAKELPADEAVFRPYFRKSLVAACDIPAGAMVQAHMVYAMRPQVYAKGLPSEEFPAILGKKTRIALKKYDPLNWDSISRS